jgi:hypothetical protein
VILEAIAVILHALGQMAREKTSDRLHDRVAEVARQEAHPTSNRIETALHREKGGQPIRAEIRIARKSILPIFLGDVECIAMQILPRDGQRLEMREDVAAISVNSSVSFGPVLC